MITLYSHTISGHSHRVRLFLNVLGLDHNVEQVDLLAGAHKRPEFLALNPFGQVPVLVDGDLVLSDSNAILIYLATRYDEVRTWWPTDATDAARVQRWLSVAAGELVRGPGNARLVKLLGAPYDLDRTHAMAERLYDVLNSELSRRDWVALDRPSIADVALYSYTAVAHEGGVDLAPYPNVQAWLKRMRGVDGFVEMTLQNG